MDPIKARLPLLLFLGSVFLAMASVSVGFAYWEKENPKYPLCVKSCRTENDASRYLACHARCRLTNEKRDPRQPRQGEEEQEEADPRERETERRRQEEQGQRHLDDPEERARERRRQREIEEREERRREKERERRRREKESEREEEEGQEKQKQKHHNPYHFRSDRFQSRFENEHGRIRVLQRFDKRSEQLRGLRNFRVVEFESKPETLILPHHSDAEYLLVVLNGEAIFTVVNQNNRESYNVEQGDVLRIPRGAISYAANRNNEQNLKILKLAIPSNVPGEFENFYPSGNRNPQSYYSAFSRQTLEATFNANYDEIRRVLFGEQEQQEERKGKEREQSSGEGVIVKLSREQIRELSRHAKSSPRGGKSTKSGPFSLRNLQPRYSNNHGNFWEACPEEFEPLKDVDTSINFLDLNEGSLFLPHYNTRATVLAYVVEGQGRLEIACPHLANQRSEEEGEEREQEEQHQQRQQQEEEDEEEQSEGQIHRLFARLSKSDVIVIPAGHPVALRASDNNNLRVIAFAINGENNERNFLGGERDNVINQIERQVKEVAFEGSGQEVERLFRNQKESYFVNAQSQQKEEGTGKRRVPLSSILGAFV